MFRVVGVTMIYANDLGWLVLQSYTLNVPGGWCDNHIYSRVLRRYRKYFEFYGIFV